MHIDRVQRWVASALTLTVAYVWALGLVLGALYTIDDDREGAKTGLLIMAGIICAVAVIGVRLINQLSVLTPWLLAALIPSVIGFWVLAQR